MSLKMGLNLANYYSINFSLPKRKKKIIKFIIIHYTGMKNEKLAIKKLCDFSSKVSSHYFIKDSGKIINLVPELYEAWHAGISNWKNFESINKYSIGIEINNPGHQHGYKNFSSKQITSLKILLKYLIKKYKIKKQNILGHSDIAPNRKKDPGEKFPWSDLAKKKLCLWHTLNQAKIKRFRKMKLRLIEENDFVKNLYKIGYSKKNTKKRDNKALIIKAFQRRYRQDLINGQSDKECYLISKNLVTN
jgi:N-acetylmuramoyl-L-alanine amidase